MDTPARVVKALDKKAQRLGVTRQSLIKLWIAERLRRDGPARRRSPTMKANEFDAKFDVSEDISEAVDWSKARRPNDKLRRVNVDFPAWVVEALDKQARHLGVTRQSLIKLLIAERLE